MYEALKAGDLKGAQKEHDSLTRLMQVVGKYSARTVEASSAS